MNSSTAVVIVAAGTGKRMRSSIPKQYLLLEGKPILLKTVEKFEECGGIDEIVVVTGKGEVALAEDMLKDITKLKAVVAGGAERQNSVWNGLNAVSRNVDYVLIHDGVRPYIEEKSILKIIDDVKKYNACVMGVPSKDTIKICDENGFVKSTPDRSLLWNSQTPQAFKKSILLKAYERVLKNGAFVTDDAMAAEYIGVKVKMTEGEYSNIKITTPEDLL